MFKFLTVFLLALLALATSETDVSFCDAESEEVSVDIESCYSPPCQLKQNTNQKIEIVFTPKEDADSLSNSVKAKVWILPAVSFEGVDGTDACSNIYNLDGDEVGCPLQKDETYVYKNEFPVSSSYPRISATVNWALKNENDDDLVCFSVPVEIV